jgi:hypothetical protein
MSFNTATSRYQSLSREISANDWAESVYKPDILNKPKQLYKKPGYDLSELP